MGHDRKKRWLHRAAIAAFVIANIATITAIFDLDVESGMFLSTMFFALVGYFLEERARHLDDWRKLKKDHWSGIRTVEHYSSTSGGWE